MEVGEVAKGLRFLPDGPDPWFSATGQILLSVQTLCSQGQLLRSEEGMTVEQFAFGARPVSQRQQKK